MIVLITIVHIIVCFFIIIVVLLQSGKSGDISAAFGGQGSQTAFGPRGAPARSPRHDMVSRGLHGHLDYAVDLRLTTWWAGFGPGESKV